MYPVSQFRDDFNLQYLFMT